MSAIAFSTNTFNSKFYIMNNILMPSIFHEWLDLKMKLSYIVSFGVTVVGQWRRALVVRWFWLLFSDD